MPYVFGFFRVEFLVLFLFCLVGFMVYRMMLSGVGGKSKYGLLGGIRARSQRVSYEVVFALFLLGYLEFIGSFSCVSLFNIRLVLVRVLFLFLVLAELNRAPFDFAEGESELVSGFNLEFGSVAFVLLFLSEYGCLLFFSVFFSCVFFNFSLFVIFVVFSLIVFIRRSYPRFRYDMMIGLFWFSVLPVVLCLLGVFVLWFCYE